MSYLHDEIDDEQPRRPVFNESHREVTLSTGTILGIFFGLALLCAIFFGFGYNMGSKSHQAPVVAAEGTSPTPSADFNSFKPAPGAPANQPAPAIVVTKQPDVVTTSTATSTEPAPIARTPAPGTTPTPTSAKPATATDPSVVISHAVPANEAGLTFIVQVAAVSHQEDADLLAAALKRKGYAVVARTEPQDKLFHIQVGPFNNKKDAEAMRQRLLTDGYNAILK
jgi:cell division septation protein DedD